MSPKPEWSILALLQWVTSYFKTHQIDSPRATAEILLAHTLNCERIDLYVKYDQPLTPPELAAFKALLKRRLQKEPVAYIVGHKEFWSMDLRVDSHVLIPRPDTECLVETAINNLKTASGELPLRILELGTGSGAIIIAIASALGAPHSYYAVDCSIQAAGIARENACKHEWGAQIHFFCGSWFDAISPMGQFDAIISNPPYIPTSDVPSLQPEITQFEPRLALDGGLDGLDAIKHILQHAYQFLKPDGYLLLEIGYDQRLPVQALSETFECYKESRFLKDFNGIDRVVSLRRK